MGIKRANSLRKVCMSDIYTTTVKRRTGFVKHLCLFQGPIMTAIRNKENPRGF